MADITLYGVTFSLYARKVRIFLGEKGLDYDLVPAAPGRIPEDVKKHTPLGKVPFARVGDRWLADSSVICRYVERLHPEPALIPADPWEEAQTLWMEEYLDGYAVPKLGPPIYLERVIKPRFYGQPCDEARAADAIANLLPGICDYLDAQIGTKAFLVADRFTLADATLAATMIGLAEAEVEPDAARWPNMARYAREILKRPVIAAIVEEEKQLLEKARPTA